MIPKSIRIRVGAAMLASMIVGLIPAFGQEPDLTSDLQAHWKFDETSGLIATDSTDNGNTGDLLGFVDDDTQWVAGRNGGAIAFNGIDTAVEVPDSASIGADLVNGFTVSAWFKSNVALAAGGNTYRMLEKGDSYFFLQGVANGGMNFLVKFEGANRTAGIAQDLEADRWYNLTGVFDGQDAFIYLDGALKGQVSVGGPIDDDQLPLRIGSDDSGRFFDGAMDDVKIWSRALTELEVRAAAGQVVAGPPSIIEQPVALVKFEGATARFRVEAEGAEPLRYLWFKNDENIRTATSPELILFNLTTEDAGNYKVRVQNDAGEVFSDAVMLEIIPVEDITTGMQARWHFDETDGLMAADDSGNDNNGELFGFADETAHWVEGEVNNALAFDGVTSLVSVFPSESLDNIGDEASFSFWINPATFGIVESAGNFDRATAWILSKGNHFSIRIVDDPGTVRFTILVRGQTAGAASGGGARQGWEVSAPQNSVDLNVWQHWVVQYRAGQVSFYKNGFRIGVPVEAELGIPDFGDLAIGNFDVAGTQLRYFEGALDEVGIWARPLSEAEILELAGKDVTGAPIVEVQPLPLKRLEGTTATFEVMVTGKRPVAFQWLHNGDPIDGATASTLTLTRLSVIQAGEYSVRITNEEGETTSDAANLTVESLDAITSGLVAYYPFDDGAGTLLTDISGNGLDGTLNDMDDSAWVAGQIGGAIRFDGIDDYIEIAHNDLLNMTAELTVSVWLNPYGLSSANHDRVIRKETNFDFVLLPNGLLRTYGIIKTPYDSPTQSWEFDVWTHFTYVYKNGTLQWFKDGEALIDPIPAQIGELSTSPLTIGNYQSPPGSINRPYLGTIDDLGIWQRALSAVEIDGIYQNGLAGKPLTEEFEPLNIRSIASAAAQIDIVFFSPFANRDYGVQVKGALTDDWSDQSDVLVTDLGDGLINATFPLPESGIGFYQIAALDPPPVFFDDFESGDNGWTHGGAQDNWELGAPTTGPGVAFSPDNVYATGLAANVGPFTDAFLRSPAIDLTAFSRQATLSYAEWIRVDSDVAFHQAAVNVLDAETLDLIEEVSVRAGETTDWETPSVRLKPDSLGKRIIIEFRLSTDDFNLNEGWFIDDVKVIAE